LKISDRNNTRNNCGRDSRYIVKTSAVLIASILLFGAALQTTIVQFPEHILTEVYAETVTGTDEDDNIDGTDDDDEIEGKGGDDDVDSEGGNDDNVGDNRGNDGDGGDDDIDSGDGDDANTGDNENVALEEDLQTEGDGGDDVILNNTSCP
jgi:hypothetical protein